MSLHLVLAEAEVELVPEAVHNHPQVQAAADRRGRPPEACVLDASDHHAALDELPDGGRRGRPDIAHLCLLLALESRLNRVDDLVTRVHCRGDRVVDVDPETRLIRHYPRFRGLLGQLLQRGQVPADRDPPLMGVSDETPLVAALEEAPDLVVVLDADGDPSRPRAAAEALGSGPATVVVGGFPEGSYEADLGEVADEVLALGDEPVMAWTAVAEVLSQAAEVRGAWEG